MQQPKALIVEELHSSNLNLKIAIRSELPTHHPGAVRDWPLAPHSRANELAQTSL